MKRTHFHIKNEQKNYRIYDNENRTPFVIRMALKRIICQYRQHIFYVGILCPLRLGMQNP